MSSQTTIFKVLIKKKTCRYFWWSIVWQFYRLQVGKIIHKRPRQEKQWLYTYFQYTSYRIFCLSASQILLIAAKRNILSADCIHKKPKQLLSHMSIYMSYTCSDVLPQRSSPDGFTPAFPIGFLPLLQPPPYGISPHPRINAEFRQLFSSAISRPSWMAYISANWLDIFPCISLNDSLCGTPHSRFSPPVVSYHMTESISKCNIASSIAW